MQPVDLRKKAFVALSSVVFFIICYVILLLAAVGLVLICGYFGIFIMISHVSMWTILFGLGIIAMGILVLIFLVKFIFHETKIDRTGMVEIYEKDQPKLFALVAELAREVKTNFPKKIYLTADINASVFYDSNFWSMFFPISKNLTIGVGLVNSITESELKAILAHEFGHFSQRSMKVGSYVYNVNKVIHNMLYDNDSFQSIINQFVSFSNIFALFGNISVNIVRGIQWVLRKLYAVVNLSYMQLSREMEFHADEIAAKVAGSEPLINSLMRLEFAENSYQEVIDFYNAQIAYNKKTENIYPQIQSAMKSSAHQFKLDIVNDLPLITQMGINRFNQSRLVIKDQWASHPTIKERVERLKALAIFSNQQNESAWNYFSSKEKIQQSFTSSLFQSVVYKEQPSSLELNDFNVLFQEQLNKYSSDDRYKDIYKHRDIAAFEIEDVLKTISDYQESSLDDIFNEKNIDLFYRQTGLVNDMQMMEQLKAVNHNIKSFDFDGRKYRIKEIDPLLEELKKEKAKVDESLEAIDRKAFIFFHKLAEKNRQSEKVRMYYQNYFAALNDYKEDLKLYQEMVDKTQFISFNNSFDDIRMNMIHVYDLEKKLKQRISEIIQKEEVAQVLDLDLHKKVLVFLAEELRYFKEPSYNNEALDLLFNSNRILYLLIFERLYQAKKQILSYQMQLMDNEI